MKRDGCPECGSSKVFIKEGQIMCNDCGAIVEELVPEEKSEEAQK